MDINNYRTSRKYSEIIKHLETMEVNSDSLTIWQSLKNDSKVIMSSVAWRLSSENKTITLIPQKKSDVKLLRKKMLLYLHGAEKSIVFKCSWFDVDGNKVIIHLPKEIKIVDHRENPRFNVSAKENRTVNHRKEIGLAGSEQYKNFMLSCYDISQTGIALELHRSHLLRYRAGDIIEITSIGGVKLEDCGAEVIYVCPLSLPDNVLRFKAGLKFFEPLSNELITKILLEVSR